MINPYRRISKVNPQRENGHRRIANDVYKALIMANLNGGEYQVTLSIIDKTWGFGKKSDKISYSQIAKTTRLTRRTVIRIIKDLEIRRILVINRKIIKKNLEINEYLFNKHYDTWRNGGSDKLFTSQELSQIEDSAGGSDKYVTRGSDINGTRLVTSMSPTKETLTKEKDIKSIKSTSQELSEEVSKEIDNLIALYKEKFVGHIRRWGISTILKMRNLIEGAYLEGVSLEDIKERIEQSDSGTPWEILSNKWIDNYRKEKKKYERLRKLYSGEES